MNGKRYTDEFKVAAVKQMTDAVTRLTRLQSGSA
jgi:hypothetical protein